MINAEPSGAPLMCLVQAHEHVVALKSPSAGIGIAAGYFSQPAA
jgi:hypothetical protein